MAKAIKDRGRVLQNVEVIRVLMKFYRMKCNWKGYLSMKHG